MQDFRNKTLTNANFKNIKGEKVMEYLYIIQQVLIWIITIFWYKFVFFSKT